MTASTIATPWLDIAFESSGPGQGPPIILLHGWGLAPGDPTYDALEAKLNPAPVVGVPTLVVHGAADACNDPLTSANRDRFFSGRYERIVLDGVVHFPSRESPDEVGEALVRFLSL